MIYTILITNVKDRKYFVGTSISLSDKDTYDTIKDEIIQIIFLTGLRVKVDYDTYNPEQQEEVKDNICRIAVERYAGDWNNE